MFFESGEPLYHFLQTRPRTHSGQVQLAQRTGIRSTLGGHDLWGWPMAHRILNCIRPGTWHMHHRDDSHTCRDGTSIAPTCHQHSSCESLTAVDVENPSATALRAAVICCSAGASGGQRNNSPSLKGVFSSERASRGDGRTRHDDGHIARLRRSSDAPLALLVCEYRVCSQSSESTGQPG